MSAGRTAFKVARPEFSVEATANNNHKKLIHLQLIIQIPDVKIDPNLFTCLRHHHICMTLDGPLMA